MTTRRGFLGRLLIGAAGAFLSSAPRAWLPSARSAPAIDPPAFVGELIPGYEDLGPCKRLDLGQQRLLHQRLLHNIEVFGLVERIEFVDLGLQGEVVLPLFDPGWCLLNITELREMQRRHFCEAARQFLRAQRSRQP